MLNAYGWHPYWEAQRQLVSTTMQAGRIIAAFQNNYTLQTEQDRRQAVLTGNLRKNCQDRDDFPVVGDWVVFHDESPESPLVIHEVLPRRTQISRKQPGRATNEQVIAANVDYVLIVTSANNEFNPRRIERFLAMVWESNAMPVIVLNKADLHENPGVLMDELAAIAPGVDAHAISALEGTGLDDLKPYLGAGRTVVLIGSSGVGKSTLANAITGGRLQPTGPVRENDDKGRHTTTGSALIPLPMGGVLIDTPGLREIQLWAEHESVERVFHEIAELADACRFRDCGHTTEPGCAVQAAIDDGVLDPDRFTNYLKMKNELSFLRARQDDSHKLERKRRDKKLHKLYREEHRRKYGANEERD